MAKKQSLNRRKATRTPILVVEDNPDHWLVIRSALAQCFPEVEPTWINHPTQALTYLEGCLSTDKPLPGLILQELYLPRRQDGLALLETVKANPAFVHLPIIMLSASQDNTDINDAYALGIASYSIKPATYHQWLTYFYSFRRYWWTAASLPPSAPASRPAITDWANK